MRNFCGCSLETAYMGTSCRTGLGLSHDVGPCCVPLVYTAGFYIVIQEEQPHFIHNTPHIRTRSRSLHVSNLATTEAWPT